MSGIRRELEHAEAWDLLPWIANGTLGEDEARAVRRHVDRCERCRDELRACRALAADVRGIDTPGPAPHPSKLAQLWQKIEIAEQGATPAAAARPQEAERVARRGRSKGLRGVLYAAAMLAAVASGWLMRGVPARPGFHTLADATVPAAGPRLRVVFEPSTSEADLRSLLREVGAEIVAGPSPLGVYTLRVVGGRDEPVAWVAAHLRARREIRFAEPLEPEAP